MYWILTVMKFQQLSLVDSSSSSWRPQEPEDLVQSDPGLPYSGKSNWYQTQCVFQAYIPESGELGARTIGEGWGKWVLGPLGKDDRRYQRFGLYQEELQSVAPETCGTVEP
ncbi:hypothetical protein TREES_T100019523 [Tupaia chinensis]|uniref:Uncharacterized protein n=1 Tax=Tupaia chinensis TaxID=246437 RepID=L9KHV9_TUPCH|nr:hypothetical protein TREES_T100019523 [Tupaia chinensis]